MKKKKWRLFLSGITALLVILALCACSSSGTSPAPGASPAPGGSSAPGAAFEKMVLQVGSATPTTEKESFYILVTDMSKRLQEGTGGAVSLEYMGDGQLGNDTELSEAIKLGTIDAAVITVAPLGANVPAMGIFDMPYLFTSDEVVYDFIDNSPVVKKIEEKLKESCNATPISWAHNGFRNTLNNVRPIKSVADFSGLKIRVMESPVYMQLFSLLGANPTPMSISECMTGLEQKTVDGMDHPITASYNAGGYKLVKYFDLTKHTCTEAVFMINNDVYNAMPPELQALFKKAGAEARAVQREKLKELEDGMLQEMEDYGVIVGRDVDVASIQKAVLPMYKDYRDKLDPEIFDETLQYLGISLS